jgi:hypothetical protein
MLAKMDNLGAARLGFSLCRRPPRLYPPKRRGGGARVPIFEPYEENLPLEAGFYTFVIDCNGRFHLRRGNVTSHSAMIGGEPAGAAGRLRINRAGNVADIFCLSQEYSLNYLNPEHPTVRYVVESFVNHPAFALSHHAVFQFRRKGIASSFFVDVQGQEIDDLTDFHRHSATEGYHGDLTTGFTVEQLRTFAAYDPPRPVKLYAMHRDQLIAAIEDDPDADPFTPGEGKPRYGSDGLRIGAGKRAFILDSNGWLIIGDGHHLLSGGQSVGAAGQLVANSEGTIQAINLNFSGHYRPPLEVNYARYTYRTLAGHPLLTLAEGCVISGRKTTNDELGPMLRFHRDELIDDSFPLDEMIESIDF